MQQSLERVIAAVLPEARHDAVDLDGGHPLKHRRNVGLLALRRHKAPHKPRAEENAVGTACRTIVQIGTFSLESNADGQIKQSIEKAQTRRPPRVGIGGDRGRGGGAAAEC